MRKLRVKTIPEEARNILRKDFSYSENKEKELEENLKNSIMVIISNQILIDFLRLNDRAINVRNQELGKQLDEIIIRLGGTQKGELPNGRSNEEGKPLGFPKTSMSYDFPENQIQNLYTKILLEII